MATEFAVPPTERVRFLQGTPAFAALPIRALEGLAAVMGEERHPAGKAIVTEGEAGDCLYLIAAGRAEVTTAAASGPVLLATLEPGEIFGEMALLAPVHERQATVKAVTPLLTLVLFSQTFTDLLILHPETKARFDASAEVMLTAKFLKRATPFARVDGEQARILSSKLEHRLVPAGAVIIRQGEGGEECYLIRSGNVEVTAEVDGEGERRLTTLGQGALFGEAALLTESPRNATVRALTPCELHIIRRADLLEAMAAESRVGAGMVELLRLRERPKRVAGIEVQHHFTAEGDRISTLKDPQRGRYYRLSSEGWFLWQRLDGAHTLRDLTLDYLGAFKVFAPHAIAGVMEGLGTAGFLKFQALRPDVKAMSSSLTLSQWILAMAHRILEGRIVLNNADRWISRFYRYGIRLAYTRPSQVILGIVTLAGLIAFTMFSLQEGHPLAGEKENGALYLFIIPAYLLAVVVHEAGHAFTVKAFGREVPRIGLGWYWIGPIAFVDTSDMWLAGRWQRVAVSLAGPYANMVLAGAASLTCLFVSDSPFAYGLWQFALVSYLMVLLSLNPLFEFDGYYVLEDLLDRPNLRTQALAWLGRELPLLLFTPKRMRGHLVELLYSIGSFLNVLFLAYLALSMYRAFLQGHIERLLPHGAALALAWVLTGGVAILSIAPIMGEMYGKRGQS